MRRSIRCKHGFCLETVGCPDCGVRVLYGASSHLRRADERRAVGWRDLDVGSKPGRGRPAVVKARGRGKYLTGG